MSTHVHQPESKDNLLKTIANEKTRIYDLEWSVRVLVKAAFLGGATWKEIGAALGCSPQAAWKQYRPHQPRKIVPREGPDHIEHDD